MAMIGITISAEAYAAISALPAGSAAEQEIAPEREYRVWLPRAVVNRLRALREPGETFSDVILRLTDRGSYDAIMRGTPHSGPNA
jgi:predicted CopG family antitoxin